MLDSCTELLNENCDTVSVNIVIPKKSCDLHEKRQSSAKFEMDTSDLRERFTQIRTKLKSVIVERNENCTGNNSNFSFESKPGSTEESMTVATGLIQPLHISLLVYFGKLSAKTFLQQHQILESITPRPNKTK